MNSAITSNQPVLLSGLGRAAVCGAKVGWSSALLYGAAGLGYILLRSSLQIGRVLSLDEGLAGTLVANAFGVLWPSLITTLMLGVVAALLGVLVFVMIYALSRRGPGQSRRGQAALGFVVSGTLMLLINLLLIQALGGYWGAFWPQGYLFWVGLPSLVFVAATTWICLRSARGLM